MLNETFKMNSSFPLSTDYNLILDRLSLLRSDSYNPADLHFIGKRWEITPNVFVLRQN